MASQRSDCSAGRGAKVTVIAEKIRAESLTGFDSATIPTVKANAQVLKLAKGIFREVVP